MKHSQLAALALLAAGLLTGCSEDRLLQDNTKTEEYVRQFIEDFGIPAEGHDFSMATSAGLQIKSSRPERIIVTAEIDGEEYEFANLTVPAGTTSLPVTIPSTAEELNIYLGLDKYTVGANETVDLDRLAESAASRGYEFHSSDRTFSVNTTGNPVLAIKYSDFLEEYFKVFPIGSDNTLTSVTTGTKADNEGNYKQAVQIFEKYTTIQLLFSETLIFDSEANGQDAEYDIFPIYWRKTENGKDYSFRLADGQDYRKTQDVSFGSTNSQIPFPKLGYSTSITSVNDVNFNNLSGFTFDNGSLEEAYSTTDNQDKVIVSEGVRISVPNEDSTRCFAFELVTNLNGKKIISSSCPINNMYHWGEKYYRTTLRYLASCRGSSKRTFLDKILTRTDISASKDNNGMAARAYGPLTIKNPDGTTESRNCSTLPFLVGFTTPPVKADDDETVRDYANALFLVVPVAKRLEDANQYYIHLGELNGFEFKRYYWVVAAEDLGGSFDWDFNDAVFAFSDEIIDLNTQNTFKKKTNLWGPSDAVPVRQIEVKPLAAGGTLPLYITFNGRVFNSSQIVVPAMSDDYYTTCNEKLKADLDRTEVLDGTWVLGPELHRWLDQDTYTKQYNTGETGVFDLTFQRKTVRITVPSDFKPADTKTSKFPTNSQMASDNKPLMGFGVLVDKENKLNISAEVNEGYYNFTPLPDYTLGKNTYLIGGPNPDKNNIAPQMIVVPAGNYDNAKGSFSDPYIKNWLPEWEWPREYVNIQEAYPRFAEWVKNPKIDWTKDRNRSKVTQNPHTHKE